ncbi:carbohydrate ABC transporter permease [Cohnella silvisoli]|uniref:Carbohydrate ABC transporter permease n=1 Tax=Cohnella silvisoli TaxID=2873699 RepID=A0ABV1KMV0_9BACL|nr:carbohydrate ABC transporter permease [Cohnella silvisoli]MCD9020536.1 carbohydrate ABC transporter permease [Cohnella silvisoli]
MRIRSVEWFRHLILFAIVGLFCIPIIELIRTSFARGGLQNYVDALTKIDLLRNLLNSTIVTGCTVLLVLLITLPAAFAFSKMRFPLKNVLFLLILLALMIPGIAIAVPVVQIIRLFDWFNRYGALIFPYTALLAPFGLVLAKGFMDQLPKEMQEASLVDGCSVFQSFVRIYLPLTKPIAMIVTVFTFLGSWNEFLFAMLFMRKATMQMVTTIPIKFQVDFVTNLPGLFAALVIIQLPILILYILFQKYFKEGLTAGAVKS